MKPTFLNKIPRPSEGWHVDAVGAALALLITLAAYVTVALPARRESELARQLREESSARESRRLELEAELYRATQEIKELTRRSGEVNLRVEGDTRLNQRIASLNDLASGAGLAVDVIEPGVGRPGVLYHVTPIQMAGKGKYAQVRAFMAALYRGMPDVPLTSMTLSAAPSTSEPSVFFTIELLWHTKADPAPQPGKAQTTNGGNAAASTR
jgi:Tfp pilus assembly protein PilO